MKILPQETPEEKWVVERRAIAKIRDEGKSRGLLSS